MARTTQEARQAIVRARADLIIEADELGSAVRSAVDVPAKVRRHPVETAGLAGGAVFLAVGGPKRVIRAAQRRLFPRTLPKYKGTLPREIERALSRAGVREDEVKARIEKDFQSYMEKKGSGKVSGTREASFWKTYDTLAGPLGKMAARQLASKLFAPEPDEPQGHGGSGSRR